MYEPLGRHFAFRAYLDGFIEIRRKKNENMATYIQRWEAAKTKFTAVTGVKKPSPKGVFNSFFNYTSLTGALKDADAAVAGLETGKPATMPSLIAAAEKKIPALSASINNYLKILDESAKLEQADNNAKTALYRNLKVLSAELKAIDLHAIQALDAKKITLNATLGAKEQAARMMKTSLASACANANLAVKSVQADPTAATFNKFFKKSDSPGRKIQVQLVSARNQLAEGKLPSKNVDPGFIAEKLTAWQSESSPNNSLALTATAEQVKARLVLFKEVLKLAQYYSDTL